MTRVAGLPELDVPRSDGPRHREPAFNLPPVVLAIGLLILIIHGSTQLVSRQTYYLVLELFAFIPAAWSVPPDQLYLPAARFWTPITYFFLHGDWVHVLANLTWFAAFGSAVARRFGTLRFLVFLALATVASAFAHYVFNIGDASPVIGASGGVSACMGAAIRFAFTPNAGTGVVRRPALGLVQSLQNRGTLAFVVLWFAFNWLFGAGIVPLAGVEGQIAWEAHMGGFLFGALAFRLFDPLTGKTV